MATLLLAMFAVNFSSCSSDSEKLEDLITGQLLGKWVIVSSTDFDYPKGNEFEFQKGGKLIYHYYLGDDDCRTRIHKWEIKKGMLKISDSEEDVNHHYDPDQYTEGTVTFADDTATYNYIWYDAGEFSDKDYTVVLQKI